MTWHQEEVGKDELRAVLAAIRLCGGVVTRSCPSECGYCITNVTLDN